MNFEDKKLEIYERARRGELGEFEAEVMLENLQIDMLCALTEEYGILPYNDSTVYESLRSELGRFIRDRVDLKQIRKDWTEKSKKFFKAWKAKIINEKEKKELEKAYDILKKPNVSYNEYKKSFDKFANFFGYPTEGIIIEHIVFSKTDDGEDKLAVRFSKGEEQVVIPNGTMLCHVSPSPTIKELEPAFRSKTVGKYLYPSPRCFFTIKKAIANKKAGLSGNLHKYTPVENIRFAYIDPSYVSFKDGSVFVKTKTPIKMMNYDLKARRLAEIDKDIMSESVEEFKNKVNEAYKNDLITTTEAVSLLYDLKNT